jgi:hypothetical protein
MRALARVSLSFFCLQGLVVMNPAISEGQSPDAAGAALSRNVSTSRLNRRLAPLLLVPEVRPIVPVARAAEVHGVETPQEFVIDISSHDEPYSVFVGGTSPPTNSYLRIENTGSSLIHWAQVISMTNGNWSTLEAMLKWLVDPAMSDDQKAHALWQFARKNYYHWFPTTNLTGNSRDPVTEFNAYGYGYCGDVAGALGALFEGAGIPARIWGVGAPSQHIVVEGYYDGGWHLFDADQDELYLKWDNRTVAGMEDLINDPRLVLRADANHAWLAPVYQSTPLSQHWPAASYYETGHEMVVNLRPNEALTFWWEGTQGTHNDTGVSYPPPPEYGNGEIDSSLDGKDPSYRKWIVGGERLRAFSDDGEIPLLGPADVETEADFVYRVDSPYPIVTAQLTTDFMRGNVGDSIKIFAGRDVDGMDLQGPELAAGMYQVPGAYVSQSNIAIYGADGNLPPIHCAKGLQPASISYRFDRGAAASPVLVGGYFFRDGSSDSVAIAISTDGSEFTQVWQAGEEDLGYFTHFEDVTGYLGDSTTLYVEFRFEGNSLNSPYWGWTAGAVRLEVSGVEPALGQVVWSTEQQPTGDGEAVVDLTPTVANASCSESYHYLVKVAMRAASSRLSVGLNSFRLKTIVQVAPHSLPAVNLGTNQFTYHDRSPEMTNVRVTHGWKQIDGSYAPDPPTVPLSPVDGAEVSVSAPFALQWFAPGDTDGDAIEQYHIEICDDPQCRWPLSSIFDMDTGNSSPTYIEKFNGWLGLGRRYYWRVRAQDSTGLWGDYGPVWSFVTSALSPRVRKHLK